MGVCQCGPERVDKGRELLCNGMGSVARDALRVPRPTTIHHCMMGGVDGIVATAREVHNSVAERRDKDLPAQ